ncbi:MAG TPA: hypothetical protein VIB39_21935 [Candidatus Angelobacter sp.]|jgi:hypothetical protein
MLAVISALPLQIVSFLRRILCDFCHPEKLAYAFAFFGRVCFLRFARSDGKTLPSVKMFSHWHLAKGYLLPNSTWTSCLIPGAIVPSKPIT